MTMAALCLGGRIRNAGLYDLDSRDPAFDAEGPASVAKVLAPVAPLFGCAVVVAVLNDMFGNPLQVAYHPPSLSSLDAGGITGFLHGTWGLLTGMMRQVLHADWHNARLYVLFGLIFSLALGSCGPVEKLRESLLGAALLTVALALLSSVSLRRGPGPGSTYEWVGAVRGFIMRTSGIAFMMMAYGMLTSLVVGVTVRLYDLAAGAGRGKAGKKAEPAEKEEPAPKRRAA
jgi:hypothetical protein